ncbi:YdeI/OmpD-associated family protein [Flaviaesturariibacter amylovorans]|uniref:YdeI/OmpD-associated family protein n=1 Tax=Flaviaesturariibacter amylovorans TaxID=1084520 RepID=A0ABP8HNU8_9BACT
MKANEVPQFYPKTKKAWRQWLQQHHDRANAVWLVQYKKSAGIPTISWSDAVDEALCFGWIDSVKKKLDEERSIQYFTKRKPNSTWSKINKEKVARLITEGRMTPAGLAPIEAAQRNGSWELLDSVDRLEVPEDLATALDAVPGARAFFEGCSPSNRKALLQWLVLAKSAATRQKRIDSIAQLAGQGLKPAFLTGGAARPKKS